jgi:hypothetical protein
MWRAILYFTRFREEGLNMKANKYYQCSQILDIIARPLVRLFLALRPGQTVPRCVAGPSLKGVRHSVRLRARATTAAEMYSTSWLPVPTAVLSIGQMYFSTPSSWTISSVRPSLPTTPCMHTMYGKISSSVIHRHNAVLSVSKK